MAASRKVILMKHAISAGKKEIKTVTLLCNEFTYYIWNWSWVGEFPQLVPGTTAYIHVNNIGLSIGGYGFEDLPGDAAEVISVKMKLKVKMQHLGEDLATIKTYTGLEGSPTFVSEHIINDLHEWTEVEDILAEQFNDVDVVNGLAPSFALSSLSAGNPIIYIAEASLVVEYT